MCEARLLGRQQQVVGGGWSSTLKEHQFTAGVSTLKWSKYTPIELSGDCSTSVVNF